MTAILIDVENNKINTGSAVNIDPVSIDPNKLNFLSAACKAILKNVPFENYAAWINGHNDLKNKIQIFHKVCIFKRLNEDEDFV